ncbi:START domain-containing protein [Aquirhabdus parva]|uniref:START domain-containing protein n=1 Tax=Aquirhabdus parva TaxID=2283318 RepID=A0A345P8S4_9GAMM|nr:START domain-containing protein [Aquirhabdus parva]AXI03683.1 hypothetical protein HYN46_13100 [Aquirhabdus parva]
MKKMLKVALLLSTLTLVSSVYAEATPQKLSIDRDGVKVWTYKEDGNPTMNFRATTVLDSTLVGAVAVVMDTDHSSEWAPYTGKALILDRNDQAGTFILRMDLDFPFPLKDRDVVISGRLSQAPDGVVTIKNDVTTDGRAPVRDKFIRIDHYQGLWQFKPLPKTASGKPQVEVTVSGYADPNGMLPKSIVNLFVQEQPFEMLRNMKNYVKAAKYQQATVVGVKEF